MIYKGGLSAAFIWIPFELRESEWKPTKFYILLESFLESFPVIFIGGLSAAFILIPFELRGPCKAISNRLMGNQNNFEFLWNPFWSHFL